MASVLPYKKKEPISIDGLEYMTSMPTMVQMEKYSEGLESCSDKEKMSKLKGLIVELGIPLEVQNSLDIDQFNALAQFFLSRVKKN